MSMLLRETGEQQFPIGRVGAESESAVPQAYNSRRLTMTIIVSQQTCPSTSPAQRDEELTSKSVCADTTMEGQHPRILDETETNALRCRETICPTVCFASLVPTVARGCTS